MTDTQQTIDQSTKQTKSLTMSQIASRRISTLLNHVRAPLVQTRPLSTWSNFTSATNSILTNVKPPSGPLIPPQSESDSGRMTVVLDMDECLLHSSFLEYNSSIQSYEGELHSSPMQAVDSPKPCVHPTKGFKYDITFPFLNPFGEEEDRVFVRFRPHLREFLTEVSEKYEPILFTSATQSYAEPVLGWLNTNWQANFRHQLYRPSTVIWPFKGQQLYVKDIRRFRDPAQMKSIVLIDNSALAQLAAPDNSITVPEFIDSDSDDVLPRVLEILREVDAKRKATGDVRPYLKNKFQLRKQLVKQGFPVADPDP